MASITFILSYDSVFGEDLYIVGNIPELGQKEEQSIPLQYTSEGWAVTIHTSATEFEYSYIVRKNGKITQKEPLFLHSFRLTSREYNEIRVYDQFTENTIPKAMLSSVFSKSIMTHTVVKQSSKKIKVPIIFNTFHPQISRDHVLAISGNDSVLGKWTEDDARKMSGEEFPKFHLICDANNMFFPLEYKYVILDKKNNTVIRWEEGKNRYLNPTSSLTTDLIIVNDKMPDFELPPFKGTGVAIPVFSLRTKKGFGTGEFTDLKLLIDWAAKTGQKIIQTLPINDTTTFHTWKDSYPYNSISVLALHPMYLNIEKAGKVTNIQKYEALRKELNSYKFVDYESVNKYKWEFINDLFEKEKNKVFKSKEYLLFFEENKDWLQPYAVFCFLRDKHKTADFSQWKEDALFQPQRVEKYCNPKNKNYNSIAIHFFVQFHLHKQLLEVTHYAHEQGVALKGDIPIGVNRNSVEVWMHPNLFDCDGQTGAPPDEFSKIGQNWKFPTYNWDEMAKDNYRWWSRRFQQMAQYFDAYRIDHILGFFRIFRIPDDQVWGLLGQFTPALPLSVEEIRKFGIDFNEKDFCSPYIHEGYLEELFGEQKGAVKKKYLDSLGDKRYQLKEKVNTQKKIEQLFENESSTESIVIKEGLMSLVCQVLFIPDVKEKNKYHPRIAIQHSLAFRTLDAFTKEALNKLYVYFYYERHDHFWKKQALKKLPPLINSTNMLVFGEDLGMIPNCVPEVMAEQEILSLEIQRMPKEMDVEFDVLEKVPYLSVCTTSTHDMSTMRAWWEEDPQRTQRYFNNVLHEYGVAPIFCEPWICQQIIEKHLYSPAMWVILPFQDWIAIDGDLRWKQTFNERINDPANPDNHWKYRMHLNLETLLEEGDLNLLIKSMIEQAGR